jgi:hypothetical protein
VLAENVGTRGEPRFFRIDLPSGLDGLRHQDRVNGYSTERDAGQVLSQANVDIDATSPLALAFERLGSSLEIPMPVACFVASLSFCAAHNP